MKLTRKFLSESTAVEYVKLVKAKFGLPKMHSQQDIDDGTLVQVGGGRHVDPSKIVKEPEPTIHVSTSGASYLVEATEHEINDEVLSTKLIERDTSGLETVELKELEAKVIELKAKVIKKV